MPIISKQPVAFSNRTFDPAAPPADMPPLAPGESAECDSDFQSNASVRGEFQQTDATHAIVTITQIKMTLQLNINIWVPAGVTQHVIEHEDGHRQVSEHFYHTADKLAGRIAATYMGKQVEITGTDLGAESGAMLQRMATEITDEYNKELNPGPTQMLYDTITDHGRNEIGVRDAVAQALKNTTTESTQPKTNPENGTTQRRIPGRFDARREVALCFSPAFAGVAPYCLRIYSEKHVGRNAPCERGANLHIGGLARWRWGCFLPQGPSRVPV